jgi:chaperonin GroES
LVRVPDEKKETDGGITIPDTHSADRPQRGTVIARGEDCLTVQVGDEVVFRKYSPDVVEIDSEKFWLLAEKDVIAVIK